jgi:hypothetical protein
MTTFQDPPPQSRRAVRQSERDEAQPQGPAQPDQFAPAQPDPYTFDAPAGESASPQAPVSPSQSAQSHTGRRAQQPSAPGEQSSQQPPSGFEPLTYSTQGRVLPPQDELSQSQPLAAAPPPGVSPSGTSDDAAFRVRDFSPEGGRRAAARASAAGPLSSPAAYPQPDRAVDLDYHTQGVAPASHSASVPTPEDPLNHTLSRRELREMRAAEEQQVPALQMPESIDTLLNSGPIDIPTLAPPPGQSQALAEAMAEFDLLTRARREAEARARDAQVASLATPIIPTQQQPIVVVPPEQEAPVQEAPVQQSAPQAPVAEPSAAAAPDQYSAPEAPPVLQEPVFPPSAPAPTAVLPSVPQPPVEQVPVEQVPIDLVPVEQVPVEQAPVALAPVQEPPVLGDPVFVEPVFDGPVFEDPVFDDRQPSSPPESGRSPRASNHWRVQAAMEDTELPYENTLSRTVGSNTSAITTSALVLPSVPQPDSLLASLNSTGEILVTGSINLPRSLGSTGAHPHRVDNSDYEDDPLDSQVSAPDSAPVRAVRAVSTNTSTRGVIETKRPQGNRMLTAVIVVAGVLCVGLVSLLVFAFITGKL